MAVPLPYQPAMLVRPFAPSADPVSTEIHVEREGVGRRSWRWSLRRDERVIARSPAGFAGAEEAWAAGRAALLRAPLPARR